MASIFSRRPKKQILCRDCLKALPKCSSTEEREQHIEGKKYTVFKWKNQTETYYQPDGQGDIHVCKDCFWKDATFYKKLNSRKELSPSTVMDNTTATQTDVTIEFEVKPALNWQSDLRLEMEHQEIKVSSFKSVALRDQQDPTLSSASSHLPNIQRKKPFLDDKEAVVKTLLQLPYGTNPKALPKKITSFVENLQHCDQISNKEFNWIVSFLLDLYVRCFCNEEDTMEISAYSLQDTVAFLFCEEPSCTEMSAFVRCLVNCFTEYNDLNTTSQMNIVNNKLTRDVLRFQTICTQDENPTNSNRSHSARHIFQTVFEGFPSCLSVNNTSLSKPTTSFVDCFLNNLLMNSENESDVIAMKCFCYYVRQLLVPLELTQFSQTFSTTLKSRLSDESQLRILIKIISKQSERNCTRLPELFHLINTYKIPADRKLLEIFNTYSNEKLAIVLKKTFRSDSEKQIEDVIQELYPGNPSQELTGREKLRQILQLTELTLFDVIFCHHERYGKEACSSSMKKKLKKVHKCNYDGMLDGKSISHLRDVSLSTTVTLTNLVLCHVQTCECIRHSEDFQKLYKDVESSLRRLQNELSKEDRLMIILLVCASYGVYMFKRYWPRVVQVVSCIALALENGKNQNKLLEIQTGEGKSCIIAMLTVVLFNKGERIHIVTSSVVLAERDFKHWYEFFHFFSIKYGTNVNISDDKKRKLCYENHVVIGTVETFAADILRQNFRQKMILGEETPSTVIVDEVDYMLLDRGVQFTYLSHDITGMRHLEPLLAMIWNEASQFVQVRSDTKRELFYDYPVQFFSKIRLILGKSADECLCDIVKEAHSKSIITDVLRIDFLSQIEGNGSSTVGKRDASITSRDTIVKFLSLVESKFDIKFVLHEFQDIWVCPIETGPCEEASGNSRTVPVLLFDSERLCVLYGIETVSSLIEEKVTSQLRCFNCNNPSTLSVPVNLKLLIEKQLPIWISNAFKAMQMRVEREYLLSNGKIIPIDFQFTGVLEKDKTWDDGLQQFLEMKHFLVLTPMSLTSNFLSNVAFFKRYKHIYGVSGTLGSDSDQKFLKEQFSLHCIKIPTYKRKRLTELDGCVLLEKAQWLQKVCDTLKKELQVNRFRSTARAGLVIAEDILTARELHDTIKAALDFQVSLYIQNEANEMQNIQKELLPGEIIVATNLAGRGTDLQVSQDVNDNGGLFVLITFLPLSERVEHQAKGRTARKGMPGSSQIVALNSYEHDGDISVKSINFSVMKEARNRLEANRMNDMKKDTETILQKDALFGLYCNFLGDVRKRFQNNENELRCLLEALHEVWAVWLKLPCMSETRVDALPDDLISKLKHVEEQYRQKNLFSHNIYYSIYRGDELMFKKDFESALKYFDFAIHNDQDWASIAFYNKAFCQINLKESITAVKQSLHDCRRHMDNYFKEIFVTLTLVQNARVTTKDVDESNKFLNHMQFRWQVWTVLQHNVESALSEIQKIENRSLGIKVNLNCGNIFQLPESPDNPREQNLFLCELSKLGLQQVYGIDQRPKFIWSQCGVIVIGLLQVSVGAVLIPLSTGILTQIGVGLITEGINDILDGSLAMIYGQDTNFKRWILNKGLNIALICLLPFAAKYGKFALKVVKGKKVVPKNAVNVGLEVAGLVKKKVVQDIKSIGSKSVIDALQKVSYTKILGESGLIIAKKSCQGLMNKCGRKLLNITLFLETTEELEKYLKKNFLPPIKAFIESQEIKRFLVRLLSFKSKQSNDKEELDWKFASDTLLDLGSKVVHEHTQNSVWRMGVYEKASEFFSFVSKATKFSTAAQVSFPMVEIGINVYEVYVTYKSLLGNIVGKMKECVNSYCRDRKIPDSTMEPAGHTILDVTQQNIACRLNDHICKELVRIIEEGVTRKFFNHTMKGVNTLVTKGIRMDKTLEKMEANANARYIAEGSFDRPLLELDESDKKAIDDLASIIEKGEKPSTLLEVKILSTTLETEFNIIKEGSDGSLTKSVSVKSESLKNGRLSLVYGNGNYRTIVGNKSKSFTSSSLYEVVAKAKKPNISEEELKKTSKAYKCQAANELRKNAKRWDPFLKSQTITMKLKGGKGAILSGNT